MPQIDSGAALSQFVGSLPTFIAVILAWMNSNKRVDDLRGELKDAIKAESSLLRAEFRRVEEVMDARLKHLEEHFEQ
jgi:hypothetical protein